MYVQLSKKCLKNVCDNIKKYKYYRKEQILKLTCKNRQETNISRAQFPQSVLPENTCPLLTATASWDSGGQKKASWLPPCNMGLRGSLRPRENMQLTKE